MPKFWLIARHAYLGAAAKRSFLLSTIGMPLLIVAVMAVSIMVSDGAVGNDRTVVGYVDQIGLLPAEAVPPTGDGSVQMLPFADEAAAVQALERGEIAAYYLVPAGYLTGDALQLRYLIEEPHQRVGNEFRAFLRRSLLVGQPQEVQERVMSGTHITARSPDGRREFSESGVANIILPIVAALFFVFAVLTSSSYLLQAVATEKENRNVEVMMTSVSPLQLVGGKAVGLMAVTLTQLALWAVTLAAGIVIGSRYVVELRAITAPWSHLGVVLLYMIPTYALVAGLMTTIGIWVDEVRDGQQIAGMLNMLFMLPLFFVVLIFTNADSPLIVGLTLFPTTSFLTVALRWSLSSIPLWQMVVSWLLLVATAVASLFGAARVFRAGMLRYGQEFSLAGLIRSLRSPSPASSGGDR